MGKPKLFYVTSSSTTSTISTTTICYVTANTGVLNAACSRKKRSSLIEEHLDPDLEDIPDVSAASSDPPLDPSYEVDRDRDTDRQARFALYWRTTTLTYSSTSYTATSTLASLHCTPSIWTYNQCGRK